MWVVAAICALFILAWFWPEVAKPEQTKLPALEAVSGNVLLDLTPRRTQFKNFVECSTLWSTEYQRKKTDVVWFKVGNLDDLRNVFKYASANKILIRQVFIDASDDGFKTVFDDVMGIIGTLELDPNDKPGMLRAPTKQGNRYLDPFKANTEVVT